MIQPLLIAHRNNSGFLKQALRDLETGAVREQVGEDFSLRLFLQSDLKNYGERTHFLLDLAAFREPEDELLNYLEGISYQTDSRVVLFCANWRAGDDFLDKLATKGFTNLVVPAEGKADSVFAGMREDIKACFSETGLSAAKYSKFMKNYKPPVLELQEEKTADFSKSQFIVSVCGAQERIGTTTFAMHICDYIARNGGKPAFVNADEALDLQLAMFRYSGEFEKIENEGFRGGNVDFHSSDNAKNRAVLRDYNAVVYDCGSLSESNCEEFLAKADEIFLVAGVRWNEIANTVQAQKKLNGLNYTVAANFTTERAAQPFSESLSLNLKPPILLPFSPGLFGAEENDKVLAELLEKHQSHEEAHEQAVG